MPSVTERLSEFIVQARLPEDRTGLVDLALRPFIDTIGCMVAGVDTDPGRVALTYAGLTPPHALDTLWGTAADGMGREAAALALGSAGSALDYDDVSAVGHPSSVLVAAALASAPQTVTLSRCLEAFLIGYEVSTRIGQVLFRQHTKHGWHATSTTGFFGATATAARLLGLGLEETRHALGIAASMAAGISRNFGTVTKPLHSGLAARGGVAAASLAMLGADAGVNALDGAQGFLDIYSLGDPDLSALDSLGRSWIMEERAPSLKKFPSCYATHRPIDAALQLHGEKGFSVAEVESVQVLAPEGSIGRLAFDRPINGLQAKFSPTYPVAAALLDGEVVIGSFADAQVRRPDAMALIERMTVREDPRCRPDGIPAGGGTIEGGFWEIEARTADGSVFRARSAEAPGTPNRQLTWAQIESKFLDCARAAGVNAAAAQQTFDALGNPSLCTDLRAVLMSLAPATRGTR